MLALTHRRSIAVEIVGKVVLELNRGEEGEDAGLSTWKKYSRKKCRQGRPLYKEFKRGEEGGLRMLTLAHKRSTVL
jgi:hypothetical protein